MKSPIANLQHYQMHSKLIKLNIMSKNYLAFVFWGS